MKSFTIALVLGAASAQSLPSVLASAKGIDDIKGVLSDYPAIVQTLAAAKDITIFLPRDGARGMSTLERYNDSPVLKRSAPGLVEATLTYHVVKGVFPAASVPASAFVETLLTNANYSSVTGGQKLQVTKTDGKVAVIGGGLPASVVAADIKFDGGIIHLIDTVLQVPASAPVVASQAGLTSLTSALSSAKLVSAIEGAKDVSIFAPTNAAFTAAGPTLSTFSAAQVSDALKYHVVPAVAFSSDLKDGQVLKTLQGGSLTVSIKDGSVMINGAKVAKADVLVKQGVVHVIDQVLVPN